MVYPLFLRRRGLLAALALTVAQLLMTFTGESSIVRTLLVIPVVLFLPGYVLTVALLPGRILALHERATLSFGLSLAAAALGGLLLNLLPWGLTPVTWACFNGAITTIGCLIALLRAPAPSIAPSLPHLFSRREQAVIGASGMLAAAALAVAVMGIGSSPTATFTQLWVLPFDTKHSNVMRLVLASTEATPETYRLVLTSGGITVREWARIALQPGKQWMTTEAIPGKGKVEALLYRLDQPFVVYRRVIVRAAPLP